MSNKAGVGMKLLRFCFGRQKAYKDDDVHLLAVGKGRLCDQHTARKKNSRKEVQQSVTPLIHPQQVRTFSSKILEASLGCRHNRVLFLVYQETSNYPHTWSYFAGFDLTSLHEQLKSAFICHFVNYSSENLSGFEVSEGYGISELMFHKII